MKIWLDDERSAPPGYEWIKSVNEAKRVILEAEAVVERVSRMEASIEELPKIEFQNCLKIQTIYPYF